MTYSTRTHFTCRGAYYGHIVARHLGCHSITAAQINTKKMIQTIPLKRPKNYTIINSKN